MFHYASTVVPIADQPILVARHLSTSQTAVARGLDSRRRCSGAIIFACLSLSPAGAGLVVTRRARRRRGTSCPPEVVDRLHLFIFSEVFLFPCRLFVPQHDFSLVQLFLLAKRERTQPQSRVPLDVSSATAVHPHRGGRSSSSSSSNSNSMSLSRSLSL